MSKIQEIQIKVAVAQISAMAMLSENMALLSEGKPVKYTADHFKKLVIKTGALDIGTPVSGDDKKVYMKDYNVSESYWVRLTTDEYGKLVAKHGKGFTDRCIEKLGNHKMAGSKKYASDYRAILKWVIDAVKKEDEPTADLKKRDTTRFGMQED